MSNGELREDPPSRDPRAALAEAMDQESLVIVVSGPGGVGKGTVVDRLLAGDDRLHVNRSWTTRDRRPGEAPDAYNFVSREVFEEHARSGGFLEWVEFLDYLQGSPVPQVPPGHDVIFEIDVAGGARIAEIHDNPVLIFIDAPDRSVQAERMRLRGDPQDKIEKRLRHAAAEVAAAEELPYRRVINDDLDTTVERVAALIEAARAARP
jgi:guanylate kinase